VHGGLRMSGEARKARIASIKLVGKS
jgi:hypothetical protein